MRPRVTALVLAAGFGTRLLPLTRQFPKPLLPVRGRSLLARTLRRLDSVGCRHVAVNLHHCGDQIRDALGDSFASMPISYSVETRILGTLGGLRSLASFLARDADVVLLLNGDSLCSWPLKRLVRAHLAHENDATLLLSERTVPAEFGGGVGVDARDRVCELRGQLAPGSARPQRRRVFAGAHALSPELVLSLAESEGPPVDELPEDIVEVLYLPLLKSGGDLGSVSTRRKWFDVGTPRRYLDAVTRSRRGGSWIGQHAQVDRGVKLRRSTIEDGAQIGRGARLNRVVVLEEAGIEGPCELRNVIVGPGVRVPAKLRVSDRMITRLDGGRAPGVGDSVVGDVVYTPLDA